MDTTSYPLDYTASLSLYYFEAILAPWGPSEYVVLTTPESMVKPHNPPRCSCTLNTVNNITCFGTIVPQLALSIWCGTTFPHYTDLSTLYLKRSPKGLIECASCSCFSRFCSSLGLLKLSYLSNQKGNSAFNASTTVVPELLRVRSSSPHSV